MATGTWRKVEARRSYATGTASESARIRNGDRIVFYVRGTGMFNCIYRTEGRWHEPAAGWPRGITDEIDLSRVVRGVAGVRTVAPLLQFVKRSEWVGLHLHGGLGNYGRPISEKDVEVITGHMMRNPRLS